MMRNTLETKYLHTVYRVQSSVWRLPNYILTPHPLSTQRVCPPPAPNLLGVHTLQAVRGWGVNISEDARDIGLASYSIIPLRSP
jgi:hypothetical protein